MRVGVSVILFGMVLGYAVGVDVLAKNSAEVLEPKDVYVPCSNNGLLLNAPCPKDSSGEDNDKVETPECVCMPGFTGERCEIDDCDDKHKCSGNGICKQNKCFCNPGFTGEACDKPTPCPKDCSDNGTCKYGKCFCNLGFEGDDCATESSCKGDCNLHGICDAGTCRCQPGWTGEFCEDMTSFAPCPDNCGGPSKGECRGGSCYCNPGFAGDDCSVETSCPASDNEEDTCGGHGTCMYGMCFCYPGWKVDEKTGSCDKKVPCKDDCGGHGTCHDGSCFCEPGYEGEACEKREKCPGDCSNRGLCYNKKCYCNSGYLGEDCSIDEKTVNQDERYKRCAEGCSGHGICGIDYLDFATGEPLPTCLCQPGFQGDYCQISSEDKCGEGDASGCSGHGQCAGGKCVCDCGYNGVFCEKTSLASDACPKDCYGQGDCVLGKCFCYPGRVGELCEKSKICPKSDDGKECSGNGVCEYGKCFCRAGFLGDDCSESPSNDDEKAQKKKDPAAMRFASPSDANLAAKARPNSEDARELETATPNTAFVAGASANSESNQLQAQYKANAAGLRSLSSSSSSFPESQATSDDSSEVSSVTMGAAVFGSLFAFTLGVAVGTVTMWYKQSQTRAKAQKFLFSSESTSNGDDAENELDAPFGIDENERLTVPPMPPMPPIPRD